MKAKMLDKLENNKFSGEIYFGDPLPTSRKKKIKSVMELLIFHFATGRFAKIYLIV